MSFRKVGLMMHQRELVWWLSRQHFSKIIINTPPPPCQSHNSHPSLPSSHPFPLTSTPSWICFLKESGPRIQVMCCTFNTFLAILCESKLFQNSACMMGASSSLESHCFVSPGISRLSSSTSFFVPLSILNPSQSILQTSSTSTL